MNRVILGIILLTGILGFSGCTSQTDPSKMTNDQINQWFEKGDWHKFWQVAPDNSINRESLAKAYHKNPERWNKAFEFLGSNDLSKLELKRYDLDSDNLFVMVSEYTSKNPEEGKYEAHRKYIDIQYVVSGSEMIGIAPITSRDSTLQEYDETKDLEFLTTSEGEMFKATPERFFIFFPENAHMPGMKVDNNENVRKIVVKVKTD